MEPCGDAIPLFGQALEHSIAHGVFELVPKPFDWVQFWAVGCECNDPHIVRESGVAVGHMETSSILDQNRDSSGITLPVLPIEMSEVLLIDNLG